MILAKMCRLLTQKLEYNAPGELKMCHHKKRHNYKIQLFLDPKFQIYVVDLRFSRVGGIQ